MIFIAYITSYLRYYNTKHNYFLLNPYYMMKHIINYHMITFNFLLYIKHITLYFLINIFFNLINYILNNFQHFQYINNYYHNSQFKYDKLIDIILMLFQHIPLFKYSMNMMLFHHYINLNININHEYYTIYYLNIIRHTSLPQVFPYIHYVNLLILFFNIIMFHYIILFKYNK